MGSVGLIPTSTYDKYGTSKCVAKIASKQILPYGGEHYNII